MDEHDVIIIGGGPSGATAGLFLRRLSPELSTLVVDRLDERKYARYHRMCGEGVSRATFDELSPLVPEHVVHSIRRAREVWPGDIVVEVSVDGYILDRPKFLQGILAKFRDAGGEVTNDALESVVRERDHFILGMTSGRRLRCRYLIGADGAQSIVRRSLFKEEPPVALWADQYIVDRKLEEDTITFIQGAKYRGAYRWEFPAGGMARIGFPRGTDEVPKGVVETHRRSIPMGGLSRIVDGNALLVGDAAALANPLTAGGIRVAMLSGRRAAEAIACGSTSRYQEWWSASPFSRHIYLSAYRRFEAMTDQDYTLAAWPFQKPYGVLKMAYAYLRRPQFRDIYLAYVSSDRYGW